MGIRLTGPGQGAHVHELVPPRLAPRKALRGRFRPPWPAVLVVASDPSTRRTLVDLLKPEGYTVHVADCVDSAMVILRDVDPSLTLVDLPDGESERLADAVRILGETPLLSITGPYDADQVVVAVAACRRHDEVPPAA